MRHAAAALAAFVSSVAVMNSSSAQEVALDAPVSTVNRAIELAINHQPEVQARWEAFLASGDDRRAVKGGYLPSVDINGDFGRAKREYDNRGWFTRDSVEVSITQMLFDGFFVRSRLEQADQSRLTRYYELLDAVQTKALEAIEAYEDVRQYRETVALAKTNQDTHQGVLKRIGERADTGVGNRVDLQQANGRLALAQANLLTEEANLHDVTARFQRIVGVMPADALSDYAVAAASVPADFGSVMAEATRSHPSLYAANSGIRAAQAAIDEAKSAYYPKLTVGARHGLYRNTNSFDSRFDPHSHGQESYVGLNLTYNLYRGGADEARASAAVRRLYQSKELLHKACIDLRQTASIAWNDVASLKVKLAALEAHRNGSAAVAAAYAEQFYIGRRTLLDVLDAKNEAFQAQRAYAQARHELNKAYYRTLYAMGVLLNVVGQSREGIPAISDFDRGADQPTSIDCGAAIAGAN